MLFPLIQSKGEKQLAKSFDIKKILSDSGISISSYHPMKKKKFNTREGKKDAEAIAKSIQNSLKGKIHNREYDSDTALNILNIDFLKEELEKHGKSLIVKSDDIDLSGCVLNFNMAAFGRTEQFFVTKGDVVLREISGKGYLTMNGLSPSEASISARKVYPEYVPRGHKGVVTEIRSGMRVNVFNTYIPPKWSGLEIKMRNRPPILFEKLVNHLFPLKLEREYFYDWLYTSLFGRAPTFLILCGKGGIGKNRLKLVMRALHGFMNSADGKATTLTSNFNAQLQENTLLWYDELRYGEREENRMKEIQNDTVSIEEKGIDATRATRLWASFVISNNKPRDNHIAFDARKFVPLKLNKKVLTASMSKKEIDDLTNKVEKEESKTFDPNFLAEVIGFLRNRGFSEQWPQLEYKGPMFWSLAHTSMTQWQKKSIELILTEDVKKYSYDHEKKAYLWSKMHERYIKRYKEHGLKFADVSSIEVFFNDFRDVSGNKIFETEKIKSERNITGDFFIRLIADEIKVYKEEDEEIRGEENEETERATKNRKGKTMGKEERRKPKNKGRSRISSDADSL